MKSNSKNIERQAWAIVWSARMANRICKMKKIFDDKKENEMADNLLNKLCKSLNLSVPEDFNKVFTEEINELIDVHYMANVEKQVDNAIELGNMMLSQKAIA